MDFDRKGRPGGLGKMAVANTTHRKKKNFIKKRHTQEVLRESWGGQKPKKYPHDGKGKKKVPSKVRKKGNTR